MSKLLSHVFGIHRLNCHDFLDLGWRLHSLDHEKAFVDLLVDYRLSVHHVLTLKLLIVL